jgi:outer membrane protein assembly factor BamA
MTAAVTSDGTLVTQDTTTSTTAGTTTTTKKTSNWFGVVPGLIVVAVVVSFVTPAYAQDERIAEIRVHGNHTTPDAVVMDLSGLKVGDPVTDKSIREAEKAIRHSHRFSDVEVRKRYLSISDPTQVLAMIVVNEKAGVSDTNLTPGIGTRLKASSMFLPIFNFQDGYGLTYGVRTTFPHAIDDQTRVSVPLSWGGERRAGVEVDHWFGGSRGFSGFAKRDPVLRLLGGFSIYRRENPYYEISDIRLEGKLRAEHPINSWLRVGATAKTAEVTFGNTGQDLIDAIEESTAPLIPPRSVEQHTSYSADAVVDTRLDPSFPRNAVYLSTGPELLRWEGGNSATRWDTDARGYVGIPLGMVVALRTQFLTSNSALPPSEQYLLGGTDTLRGYDAGFQAADNMATVSTELRIPLASPTSFGRFGVKGFVDWGTTWANGSKFANADWQRGIGGGVYFGAGPLLMDLAAAWAEDGSARVNFGLGVSF